MPYGSALRGRKIRAICVHLCLRYLWLIFFLFPGACKAALLMCLQTTQTPKFSIICAGGAIFLGLKRSFFGHFWPKVVHFRHFSRIFLHFSPLFCLPPAHLIDENRPFKPKINNHPLKTTVFSPKISPDFPGFFEIFNLVFLNFPKIHA